MSKLRIGLLGAGGRGINCFAKSFVNHFADDTEIVAVADTNTVRARKAVEVLGIEPAIHDNAGDLVSRADVDAVVICVPNFLHESVTCEALAAYASQFTPEQIEIARRVLRDVQQGRVALRLGLSRERNA